MCDVLIFMPTVQSSVDRSKKDFKLVRFVLSKSNTVEWWCRAHSTETSNLIFLRYPSAFTRGGTIVQLTTKLEVNAKTEKPSCRKKEDCRLISLVDHLLDVNNDNITAVNVHLSEERDRITASKCYIQNITLEDTVPVRLIRL